MIKYSLKCADGHRFESWFASADAFDALAEGGQLSCAVCGDTRVEKALMAPRITTSRTKSTRVSTETPSPEAPSPAPNVASAPNLSEPGSEMEAALAEFRARVEANTVDVGREFASEARAMHEGTAPERAIRGQANVEEARDLIEDGVPVMPLPFPTPRQVN